MDDVWKRTKLKTKSFFGEYNPPTGLNADLDRHTAERDKIQAEIDELEALETRSEMQELSLKSYRHFMTQVMDSRDIVANKIGRNGKQKG